jgi:hypothetical protein
MKIVIGVLIGLVVGVLAAVFIINGTFSAKADESVSTETGEDLSALLPDIGKIYRQSLGSPFREVEDEIYDEDIANFYHKLMQDTGLDRIGLEDGE